MPLYMLDTNTVSLALRGRAPRAVGYLRDTERADVAVSVVTAMELRFGLAKNRTTRARDVIEQFLDTVAVVPIDRAIERPYGEVRAAMESSGHPIG
jgi:tRNA(fMet)-specific endonuclease VapC